jgi:hypothetical protein
LVSKLHVKINPISTRIRIEKGVEIVITTYPIGGSRGVVYSTNIVHLTTISVSHIIAAAYGIKRRVVAPIVGVDAI